MPQQIIDPHFERRYGSIRICCADVGQRGLAQSESLKRGTGVAASEQFLDGFAVRGRGYIGVYSDRLTDVWMLQVSDKCDCRTTVGVGDVSDHRGFGAG